MVSEILNSIIFKGLIRVHINTSVQLAILRYLSAILMMCINFLLARSLSPGDFSLFSVYINIANAMAVIAIFGAHRKFPLPKASHNSFALPSLWRKLRVISVAVFFVLPLLAVLGSLILGIYFDSASLSFYSYSIMFFCSYGGFILWFQCVQFLSGFDLIDLRRSYKIYFFNRLFLLFWVLVLISFCELGLIWVFVVFCISGFVFFLTDLVLLDRKLKEEVAGLTESFTNSFARYFSSIADAKWLGLDSIFSLLIALSAPIYMSVKDPGLSGGFNFSIVLINGSLLIGFLIQIKINSLLRTVRGYYELLDSVLVFMSVFLLVWALIQVIVYFILGSLSPISDVFGQASEIYHFVAVSGFFALINKAIVPILISCKNDSIVFLITVVSGVFSLFATLLLVNRFGLDGAVFAYVFGYFISSVLLGVVLYGFNDGKKFVGAIYK